MAMVPSITFSLSDPRKQALTGKGVSLGRLERSE